MAMIIANNIAAMNTTRQLNRNNRQLQKSLEKLSSGFRINTGADAPADLIISEQLRAQNLGLQRAVRNTNEAMNVLGIAEGALNEMNAILKKMRALALHAANSGVTSPAQVAADQSEVDSGIQTLDRIASTTRYSNQFLLNGSKGILFNRSTDEGNNLLDLGFTRIDSVFKLEGTTEILTYQGLESTGDAAKLTTQATKGFMESGATAASRNEINALTNQISADQRFTVTGRYGSREFSFVDGTDLSDIADAISNVSDSLGVEATVVMAPTGITKRMADQAVADAASVSGNPGSDVPAGGDFVSAGQPLIFGNGSGADPDNRITQIDWTADPILGKSTDGHGRIYVEWTGTTGAATVNLYKAPQNALTGEYDEDDLVASGSADLTGGTVNFTARNNSGLSGNFSVTLDGGAPALPADSVIATHSVDRTTADRAARVNWAGTGYEMDFIAATAGDAGNDISIELVDPGVGNASQSISVSGNAEDGYAITINLATDANGDVTTAVSDGVDAAGADTVRSLILNDAVANTLVSIADPGAGLRGPVVGRAQTFLTGGTDASTGMVVEGELANADSISVSGAELGVNTDADGKLYFEVVAGAANNGADRIRVFKDQDKSADSLVAEFDGAAAGGGAGTYYLEERNDSGLRIAIYESVVGAPASISVDGDSTLTFEQGLRMSSTDYGAENFVRIQAAEGNMWDVYDPTNENADSKGYVNLLDSDTFVTVESRGTGGTLSVNGLEIFTNGLEIDAATPDFNGHLEFNSGSVGETTLARVGQNKAYSTTAIGEMVNATNMAVNAGVNIKERMTDFQNGMQFQLGEGAGDQERTIYGIQSMTAPNIGKVRFSDDFLGTGVVEEKTLSLSDMLGGGFASLAVDPIKSLAIIDQAIDDVAGLRARLGAAQANLLQTNANNLGVAIENIQKTESAIRDADMAMETTEFTKNQIMTQAATSMLAQANQAQQQVLQLLG